MVNVPCRAGDDHVCNLSAEEDRIFHLSSISPNVRHHYQIPFPPMPPSSVQVAFLGTVFLPRLPHTLPKQHIFNFDNTGMVKTGLYADFILQTFLISWRHAFDWVRFHSVAPSRSPGDALVDDTKVALP